MLKLELYKELNLVITSEEININITKDKISKCLKIGKKTFKMLYY